MTRKEAIALLNEQYETCKRIYDCSADQRKSYQNVPQFMEALGIALSALRPITREQVAEVWRAHWNESTHLGGFVYCSRCGYNALEANNYTFCPKCGSPFTDEAVEMVMERLEGMDNGTVPCDNA
jgi:hypothetical protein